MRDNGMIPCKQCKKMFSPRRDWQRFCSKICREAYWKQIYHEKAILNSRLEKIEKKLGIK